MTKRAFLLGLVAAALIAAVTPWNDFAKGNTFLTGNHFPAGAVAILLLLTLVANVALKLLRRRWALSQAELMLVWCMMAVASTVPASGLMRYWFSICASPAYYAARPDLPYGEHVLPAVPGDLVLTKDPRSPAASRFFEGVPGAERVRIPWDRWARPIASWGVFIALFYLCTFFVMGILRKQWVERERLIFPLARVPMEFTEEAGGRALLPAMVKSRAFLIGCCASLAFTLVRTGPVMAGAEGGWEPVFPVQEVLYGTPLGAMDFGSAWIYPIAIGIAFLVPADIALSVWLFFVLTRCELQFSHWIGRPIQGGTWGAFMAWQQVGAYVVFVLMAFWATRRHLIAVARKATGLGRSIDDSDEPISYRVAFWGLLITFFGMAGWFVYYGMGFFTALLLLAFMFTLVIGLARLVAQGGLFFVQQRWQPPTVVNSITGGRAFSSAAAVVAQMQNAILIFDAREILSGHAANVLRISSVFERHRRWFLPAMLAALAVAVGVCSWATLYTYYRVGGYSIPNNFGTVGLPMWTYDGAHAMIATPARSAEPHYGPMALGAAVMFFFTVMRMRFYWWPVHSLGFLMAASYPAHKLWFSFLLGWLAKVVTLKYVGGSMLRVLRSFFLGVIIAESAAIGVSTVLGLLGIKLGYIFLPS